LKFGQDSGQQNMRKIQNSNSTYQSKTGVSKPGRFGRFRRFEKNVRRLIRVTFEIIVVNKIRIYVLGCYFRDEKRKTIGKLMARNSVLV
jgi:hypothetical protein